MCIFCVCTVLCMLKCATQHQTHVVGFNVVVCDDNIGKNRLLYVCVFDCVFVRRVEYITEGLEHFRMVYLLDNMYNVTVIVLGWCECFLMQ